MELTSVGSVTAVELQELSASSKVHEFQGYSFYNCNLFLSQLLGSDFLEELF